ncbi:nucleotide exchange factor GrpE [Metamycoplasma buccale]|uniref:nucleotide exchange factor GrpE n=1 Tax=Metamycoplasma buccale TaxID=55602 RepID=UPI00398EF7C8
MKINNYDYLELKIKEFHGKKEIENKDEIIKTYIKFDNKLDKHLEDFLIDKEIPENKKLIYYSSKDKKNRNEIEIINHVPTPEQYISFLKTIIEKNKIIDEEEKIIDNLNLKIDQLKIKSSVMEQEFKSQVTELQKKAQEKINEHKQKNNEHLEKQLKESKDYALQKFLEELILPLNNFELAINSAKNIENNIVQNFIKGFKMLYGQIEQVLYDFKIAKIIPKVGDLYDPNIHQNFALVDSNEPKDTIIEVKNIGYKLNNRTIKPALVIVSKGTNN